MKDVTIYSTTVCHFCNLAKEYFKAHNIAYTEHNVGTDVEKRKEMVEMTGQMGVPVIRIGDEVVVGFREDIIADMLKRASEAPVVQMGGNTADGNQRMAA